MDDDDFEGVDFFAIDKLVEDHTARLQVIHLIALLLCLSGNLRNDVFRPDVG